MYHDQWPMRHPSLLFAGLALKEQKYLDLWKTLPADSTVEEVIRNFFVRQPVLWLTNLANQTLPLCGGIAIDTPPALRAEILVGPQFADA